VATARRRRFIKRAGRERRLRRVEFYPFLRPRREERFAPLAGHGAGNSYFNHR
jgi:hypothetical protein